MKYSDVMMCQDSHKYFKALRVELRKSLKKKRLYINIKKNNFAKL